MVKEKMVYRVWYCPESGIMDYQDFQNAEIGLVAYQMEVDRSKKLGLSLPSFMGPISENTPAI